MHMQQGTSGSVAELWRKLYSVSQAAHLHGGGAGDTLYAVTRILMTAAVQLCLRVPVVVEHACAAAAAAPSAAMSRFASGASGGLQGSCHAAALLCWSPAGLCVRGGICTAHKQAHNMQNLHQHWDQPGVVLIHSAPMHDGQENSRPSQQVVGTVEELDGNGLGLHNRFLT